MNEKVNPDNDSLDPSEEYWREQNPDEEDEPYFPSKESRPPHYQLKACLATISNTDGQ